MLVLDQNNLTSTLPRTWGQGGGFRQLHTLWLGHNNLHGSLPAAWAEEEAFPNLQPFSNLQVLSLDNTSLSGELPPSWAAIQAFPSLLVVNLSHTYLEGPLPAFDNAKLNVLDLEGCNFNSTLDDLWSSPAPVTAIEASNNNLSGSLPEAPGCLSQLAYLGLRNNRLEGTIPLTWLQAGGMLSHVSHLDLGAMWDYSVGQADWRQELCLQQPVVFYADVTGQQASLLPGVQQHMAQQRQMSVLASRNLTDFSVWLESGGGSQTEMALADRFLRKKSQLMSVRQICRNSDSRTVLLILWGVFGGCCLIVVGTYAVACKLATRAGPTYFGLKSWLSPLWAAGIVVIKACSGFGGLAFYWYDCVTGVIVMCEVWHTWPGHVLAIIFFFHFAAVGAILACHAVHRLAGPKRDNDKLVLYVMSNILVVVLSPLMIPVVILLDTVALVREVLMFIKHVVRLPGLKWLEPGYVAVFKFHRCVHSANCLGLSWVDLEKYEDMHNLVAAACQSLPTVILNSVIYALGNKPSNGIYLSDGLFVTAVVASCLAILKCLLIILWQTYKQDTTAAGHIGSVVIGKTLAGKNTAAVRALHPQNSNVELLAQKYTVSGSAPLGL